LSGENQLNDNDQKTTDASISKVVERERQPIYALHGKWWMQVHQDLKLDEKNYYGLDIKIDGKKCLNWWLVNYQQESVKFHCVSDIRSIIELN
jgi:hypothetical protein